VIEVEAVTMPGATTRFCKTWWPIYADDPQWVPPLIFERKEFFDPKKNPYFNNAEVAYFIARQGGRDVGTIAATVDQNQLETEPGLGLFGFFEFIDDTDVAKALFDAACEWLREKGMRRMRGPFNLSPNHEFGLLVDGFDTPPCIANPHNLPYYATIYESLGLVGVKDWFAYWMDNDGPAPKTISRIAQRYMDRNPKFSIRPVDKKNWAREIELVYEIYQDAWEHNWGHVSLTKEEFWFAAKGLKQVVEPDLCFFALIDGKEVGVSVTLPDYNQVAKKMNGRLFPFGWWHFLRGRGKIDTLRIFILGIKQEYQRLPLGAPLYLRTWEAGMARNVRGAEASLILEDNVRMRGALEKLGAYVYKTYRSYEYPLEEGVTIGEPPAEAEPAEEAAPAEAAPAEAPESETTSDGAPASSVSDDAGPMEATPTDSPSGA